MQENTAYQLEQEEKKKEDVDLSSSYSEREEMAYRIAQDIDREISPPFSDISSRFAEGLTDTIYNISNSAQYPTRKESIGYFDRQFLGREIKRVKGNITQYVRDAFSTDDESEINNKRRNIYRQIERFDLAGDVDNARPWKQTALEDKIASSNYVPAKEVETTLTSTLSSYKEMLDTDLYDDISSRIKEKAPLIAEKISPYMPTPANRLKNIMDATEGTTNYNTAKGIFEKQIVYDALEAAGFDKKKAAEYLGDSVRTLNRRISELGVDDKRPAQDGADIIRIEDAIKDKMPKPERHQDGLSKIERFQQMVQQYNDKRETARKKKELSIEQEEPAGLKLII